jgi:tetratricopeptide (TPR) repeat protein
VNVNLGDLACRAGEFAEAREWYSQALAIAKAIEEPGFEAAAKHSLSDLEFRLGNTDRAIELGREALGGLRQANWLTFLITQLINLAQYLLAQKKVVEARIHSTECFQISRPLGGRHLYYCVLNWAFVAAQENQFVEAALLMGYVQARLTFEDLKLTGAEQVMIDEFNEALQSALPFHEFQARLAEGRAWTEQEGASFVESRLIGTTRKSAADKAQ